MSESWKFRSYVTVVDFVNLSVITKSNYLFKFSVNLLNSTCVSELRQKNLIREFPRELTTYSKIDF